MLTVPEAAKRVDRDPETVRRWIRRGRLRSEKVGTQHLIDERDLDALTSEGSSSPPGGWGSFPDGTPQLDWAAEVRGSRDSH